MASLPIIVLCLPLGGVSVYEVLAAYLGLIVSVVLFGAIGVFCSSYFSRTSSSLVVSYLVILPLVLGAVLFWGAGRWIPDSPARRRAITERLRTWNPFSNSSPVEGIQAAINTYYSPDKRISIYVFGDDFTGESIEQVVDQVDRVNVADDSGRRRVRIHAVAFPVYLARPSGRVYRFAALMRELAFRNDGTFVGLSEFE